MILSTPHRSQVKVRVRVSNSTVFSFQTGSESSSLQIHSKHHHLIVVESLRDPSSRLSSACSLGRSLKVNWSRVTGQTKHDCDDSYRKDNKEPRYLVQERDDVGFELFPMEVSTILELMGRISEVH